MAVRKRNFDESAENTSTTNQADIILHISSELQHRITIAALQHHLSLNEYVEHILDQATENVDAQHTGLVTQEGIERLRQTRQRIMQRRNGHRFEDSAEAIRRMCEERTKYLEEL